MLELLDSNLCIGSFYQVSHVRIYVCMHVGKSLKCFVQVWFEFFATEFG